VVEVHMVLTSHGEHGVGISSPQLPGLIAGEPSLADISPEHLWTLAHDVLGDDLTGITAHIERLLELDGQIFALRWKHDYASPARAELARSMESELTANPEFRADWPQSALGDAVITIALPGDKLAPIVGALTPDEPLMIVVGGEEHCEAIHLAPLGSHVPDVTVQEAFARASQGLLAGSLPAEVREFQLA
jgi:hypothetical protein